jgi:phage gp46-like protein
MNRMHQIQLNLLKEFRAGPLEKWWGDDENNSSKGKQKKKIRVKRKAKKNIFKIPKK